MLSTFRQRRKSKESIRILNKDPSTALRSAQDDSVCHSEGAKSPKNLNRNDVIGKADRVRSKVLSYR